MLQKILFPLLILIIFIFLLFNRVTKIECNVINSNCSEELISRTNKLKGSSFFFSDFETKLANDDNQKTIYILDSINKTFPNTIVLNFVQEQIDYELIFNQQKNFIGDSGKIIPQESNSTVTSIEWKNEYQVVNENKVDQKYHQIFLTLADYFNNASLDKAVIYWENDSEIVVEIHEQPRFVFDIETIQTQVKKIDTIIKARELEEIEEPILEIDMRFNLPVLRTRQ